MAPRFDMAHRIPWAFWQQTAPLPDADPSEPCFEPKVVELLRDVEKYARSGDVGWLRQHGKVYAAVEAA